MPDPTDLHHLSNHHRETLTHLWRHPAGHNIGWLDVVSLLKAVGSTQEGGDGSILVTLGGETQVFHRRDDKDVDPQQIADLRRMMRQAGYDPAG